jgi:hypothetical protein
MGGDVILDARPFEDVRLRNLFDEVRSGTLTAARLEADDMLVVRKPALTESYEAMDDTSEKLVRPLVAQLRKRYNWLFTHPQASDRDPQAESARRVFCSELCVLMLHHLNAAVPGSWRPSQTLPVHFQDLVSHGWTDVTDVWRDGLNSIARALTQPSTRHGHILLTREETSGSLIRELVGWSDVSENLTKFSDQFARFDDLQSRARHVLAAEL